MLDQLLKQLVTVELADQAAGIVVVGNVGRILGQEITDYLIDGVIPFSLRAPYTAVRMLFISSLLSSGTTNLMVLSFTTVSLLLLSLCHYHNILCPVCKCVQHFICVTFCPKAQDLDKKRQTAQLEADGAYS